MENDEMLETELDKTKKLTQKIRTTECWSQRMKNNDKMLEPKLDDKTLELEDGEQ